MTYLFASTTLFSTYIFASVLLAITPGPGVIYIVTRSVAQGWRAGLMSAAAIAAGNLCNALAASAGLGTLFAISTLAYTIVKYLGAFYLILIGLRMLLPPTQGTAPSAQPGHPDRVFQQGFVVALFNPKTALFFAAFLPQFVAADSNPLLYSAALGTIFVIIAAITDSLYAMMAGLVSQELLRSRNAHAAARYFGGAIFVALGVFTTLFDTN